MGSKKRLSHGKSKGKQSKVANESSGPSTLSLTMPSVPPTDTLSEQEPSPSAENKS